MHVDVVALEADHAAVALDDPLRFPEPIGVEDLGVVCWMGVLPAA